MSDDWVWIKTGVGRYSRVRRTSLTGGEVFEEPRGAVVSGAPRVSGEHRRFSPDEQRSLSIQSGRRIETYGDLKRYCEDNGSRVVERGDHVQKAIEENRGSEAGERVRRAGKGKVQDFPLDKLVPWR